MARLTLPDFKVLNAVSANGWGIGVNGTGTGIHVRDYRHIMMRLTTSGSTTATLKLAGSTQDATPTFSSTQSMSNHWDYVAMFDMNDPSLLIKGDTGIVLTGTDVVKTYYLNLEAMEWINIEVSGYSAGIITAELSVYND